MDSIKIVTCLSLLSSGLIAAADRESFLTSEQKAYLQQPPNTYKGQAITPETILGLLTQVVPGDSVQEAAVQRYIQEKGIADILSGEQYQKTFFCGAPEERQALKKEHDDRMRAAGIQNLSRNNYVFEVPDTDLVVKKTCVPTTRQNLVATSERNKWEGRPAWQYGRTVSPEEYERWKTEVGGRTYQNTSRAMTYLRAKEAAEIFGTSELVSIPETQLVHIPGRPTEVDDTNYVVVEKKFGERSDWNSSHVAIDEPSALAVTKLTAATGWWEMKDAGSVVDGKLCYHDQELPNDHDITKVYHRDKNHFRALAHIGWNQLENQIIKPYADAHKDNPEVQQQIAALLAKKHALQEEIKACWE